MLTVSASVWPLRTDFRCVCSSCLSLFGAVVCTIEHTIWPQNYGILASPFSPLFWICREPLELISVLLLWQSNWVTSLKWEEGLLGSQGFNPWSVGPLPLGCSEAVRPGRSEWWELLWCQEGKRGESLSIPLGVCFGQPNFPTLGPFFTGTPAFQ